MSVLEEERKRASFDVRALTTLLDGGPEYTRAKEVAAKLIERDPILNMKHPYDLARPEERALVMEQVRRVVAIKKNLKKDPLVCKAFDYWMNRYNRSMSMRTYVHDTLFRESIFTHGTPEQWAAWKDDVENWRVIGCFAMTELGHSSFLRGLETTATYDKETQEFIIHSPTLTATKWWIGMAGQTATHTVALCKLIIDGQEQGIHWFIVQLRDLNTGNLMPGVTAGDVGAKIARNGLDNGWIQFTHVRIPRNHMLMKWAQVAPDSRFTAPPNPAISYNTLIGERLVAAGGVADAVSSAVTIAIRYGAVRRQGPNDEQILDYQSHQWALMPVLSGAFAYGVIYSTVMHEWEQLLSSQNQNQDQFLAALPDWHAVAASLKAWGGWWGADALETIRRTMGGHAYSAYAGIGSIMGEYAVVTTGGGDNIVLAQQSTKQLLGALRRVMTGKKVAGSTTYFADIERILSNTKFQPKNAALIDQEPEAILFAFRWLTLVVLKGAALKLSSGGDFETLWNENMMESLGASRAHNNVFTLEVFLNFIREQEKKQNDSTGVIAILKKLWSVFALSLLTKESGLFLELGYMDGAQTQSIRNRFYELCKELRMDAVPLVDSFDIPDFIIKSPLGRYDGNIYPNYFRTVVEAPGAVGVPPYFEQSIAPLTRRAKL